ncbi:MAG: sensor histidine kinase [Chitinophagales bacterium]
MKLKFSAWIIISLMSGACSVAQSINVDSIHAVIENTQNDTVKIKCFTALFTYYAQPHPDSSYLYGKKLLDLSRRLNLRLNQVYALSIMGFILSVQDRYIESLSLYNEALALAENPESEKNVIPNEYIVDEENYDHPQTPYYQRIEQLGLLKADMAILYHNVKDDEKGYQLIKDARLLAQTCENRRLLSTVNLLAGIRFTELNMRDSALNALKLAWNLAIQVGHKKYLGSILLNFGRNYLNERDTSEAMEYYRNAIFYSKENYPRGAFSAYLIFARLFLNSAHKDSSLYYANEARKIAESQKAPDLELRVFESLATYYLDAKIKDSIIKYQGLVIQYKKNLEKLQQTPQFGLIEFKEQKRFLEIEAAQKEYRNRLQTYGYIAGLAVFSLIAILLWRNNRNIQKANRSLKLQKEETEKQKSRVEQMFTQLQSTQAQLIQSEKMASLGELTAGIAHEIQNPLNFVNNFSEVNTELFDEMEKEFKAGNSGEAFRVAANIRQNLDKINQHGKRAETIVKSMLQHSRVSTSQKEASDLNIMAEETLRLSYLGMRAKDDSFHCELKTNFDRSIGKVNVIPEDFRRVLLNLFNNSFYSVSQKIRKEDKAFKPELSVATSGRNGQVEIKVRDNGMGIPKKIMDKIFQPFFTTKPAGQGTGLGLSLAYDIIVNEHGGELVVDSEEGNFAEFIVKLPGSLLT